MLAAAAFAVSLLVAAFLVALGFACLLLPERARRFLGGFASSARLHLTEVALRLIAGAALILSAPRMRSGGGVAVFGWMVVLTSLVLALVPWRLHQRFAAFAMPHVYKQLRVVGLVAVAGGFVLLGALVLPRIAV